MRCILDLLSDLHVFKGDIDLEQALTSDVLMPPIDVALVWFTHMLQSKEYNEWCNKQISVRTQTLAL